MNVFEACLLKWLAVAFLVVPAFLLEMSYLLFLKKGFSFKRWVAFFLLLVSLQMIHGIMSCTLEDFMG